MTIDNRHYLYHCWHRISYALILCFFALFMPQQLAAQKKGGKQAADQKVYLERSNELLYDEFKRPGLQIVKGNVAFRHLNNRLKCDSAYFNQNANSFVAFGHVVLTHDNVTLTCDYANYDGTTQMVMARRNVVLKQQGRTLYCDSLNYDRKFNYGYFFEGGKMVDGKNLLVADWGQYNTETHEADFYYGVVLKSPKYRIETDTLHYNSHTGMAHVVGKSVINNEGNIIHTDDGYYNSKTDHTELHGRSTVVTRDKTRTIVGDELNYDSKTGISRGRGNVVYVDSKNKNALIADYCYYDDKKGYALVYDNAVAKEFSQGTDTLYLHSDTIRMYSYFLNTDSMYRKVHCYNKVRAYRTDVQAVCDSMVFSSLDSCMVMYRDPIVWNENRQLLGDSIKAYMNDSTIRFAHVMGQALSVEQLHDKVHYNQVASKEMKAYFDDGKMRMGEAIGHVQSVYFMNEDNDTTLTEHNYLEGDTMRLYLSPERKLQKIWVSKPKGTVYPITQIPPDREKLPGFAWFDYVRPLNKDDIFRWRGKKDGTQLKQQQRRAAPLQRLNQDQQQTKDQETSTDENSQKEQVDRKTPKGLKELQERRGQKGTASSGIKKPSRPAGMQRKR